MVLAINNMYGRDPCNKMRPPLQQKKAKVRLYLLLIWQQKALYVLYIAKKMELFSFKSWYVEQVTRSLKENWFIVLL